jgi:predicted MFS family arabinose efflux permease
VARERRFGRLVRRREAEERDDDDVLLEVPLPHATAPTHEPRLLTNRPFLWLVLGDSFAQLGRWAFFLAVLADATYRFDATPAQVSLVIGLFSLPLILVSPLHGAVADRASAKWLLVATSFASISVPLVVLSSTSLAWLYAGSALYGAIHAAELPARGAMVPRLVAKDRLVQANGMLSGALAVQMIVGPGVAALLARVGGPTAPYYVTLVAAIVAGCSFLVMPDRRRAEPPARRGMFADVSAGLREAWRSPGLRTLLFLDLSVWFLIGLLISLEPSYIRRELGLGEDFLGLVWSTYGAGELIGALLLSRVRRGGGRELVLAARGLLLAAVGFLIYVTVVVPWTVIAANVVFGIGFPFFTASAQAMIQRVAGHPGKVSAAFSMVGEAGPVTGALLLAGVGGALSVRGWLLGAGVLFAGVALAASAVSRRVPSPQPT